jgi:pimeloyl-ACP methyl ester carboxylesterase
MLSVFQEDRSMSPPDVVWLNTSPSLQCFAQPLICHLSHHVTVAQWNYQQDQDTACSFDSAIVQLHQYLTSLERPVHLIGHSTSGLLGLLYAHRYPDTIESLTLLAVGSDAAVDWQAHYYTHRPFLSRQKILTAMVYNLFGYQDEQSLQGLMSLLEQDLECSLSPHSLFQRLSLPPRNVSVPLMIYGSHDDRVVEIDALQKWQPWLKTSDRLLTCSEGRHFFHFFQAPLVAEQILSFWNDLHPARLSLLQAT